MSTSVKKGYCCECEKQTSGSRPKVNHVLHLLLTLLTGGLWLVAWLLVVVNNSSKDYHCMRCGNSLI